MLSKSLNQLMVLFTSSNKQINQNNLYKSAINIRKMPFNLETFHDNYKFSLQF